MEKWRWAFRASAMPACQLQQVWFKIDDSLGELPRQKRTYFSDFFLNVGTAVHSATQRWLGRNGVLFGNWMCEACGRDADGKPLQLVTERFGPQYCPKHKTEMTYEEFGFDDLPTGHCDGLIKLGALTPGVKDFVLLELKTSSRDKIKKELSVHGIPFSYKLQAAIYTHKLIQRGYNIVGTLFIFIPRDMPRGMWPYWFKAPRPAVVHNSLVAAFRAAEQALADGDYSGLSGACASQDDARDCPYRVNCFSPVASTLFAGKAQRFHGESVKVMTPTFPPSE